MMWGSSAVSLRCTKFSRQMHCKHRSTIMQELEEHEGAGGQGRAGQCTEEQVSNMACKLLSFWDRMPLLAYSSLPLLLGCRLEVGQIGVLKFGGPEGAVPLHPLTTPFTDAAGPGIMSGLRFDKVCSGLYPWYPRLLPHLLAVWHVLHSCMCSSALPAAVCR
jgi:hypothetical protein